MLLVNLAYCLKQPTGTTTYALNLLPYLNPLEPVYLSSRPLPGPAEQFRQPTPTGMTAAAGMTGHLKRLWWTQTQLPMLYRSNQASLLFSPLPEAPINSTIRSVVMVHDLIPLRFYRPWAAMHLYSRYYMPWILAQAEHIICNSKATAEDVIQFFRIPAKSISIVPLAYDETRFRWLNVSTQNYFLCLGRCAPYKNWHRVIAAFAQLPQRSHVELWLVGPEDPRYTPRLKAQAQALGIQAQVKFLNFLPETELIQVLNQAMALVFPSLWEGFGLPILEAMACGTPVITANLASMPEVAGDAALLVDPYQVEEIAQAMHQIGQDEQLRSHLRQAGFQRIQQFSQRRMGEATAAILQTVDQG
jgi:glycosyltransferase involved in cell wall biosynthesis